MLMVSSSFLNFFLVMWYGLTLLFSCFALDAVVLTFC